MQCIQLSVWFSFLFIIYVSNVVSTSNKKSGLSREQVCSILQNQLTIAKNEVAKDEAFRDELARLNLYVMPDDPAFPLLHNIPLTDELIKIYHDSAVIFEVSRIHAYYLFQNVPPRSQNINPLLSKNSYCIKDYIKEFCVTSKQYRCPKNQKYRRIDGYCTSCISSKEGAANTPFASWVHQTYDDSISKYRTEARTRKSLPLARKLSSIFFDECRDHDVFEEYGPSIAGAQFGVFITADITALAYPRSAPSVQCCEKDYSKALNKTLLHKSCDPIKIPKDDKFFGPIGITCMNFLRTTHSIDNDCVMSSLKPLNLATSWLDLSITYGNMDKIANEIRLFSNGLLRTNANNLYPEDENGEFIFYDFRAPASAVTIVLSLVFIREHNRIAQILLEKFPMWNDETLYQEARRWNIAQYQYIVLKWIKIFIPDQYKDLRLTKQNKTKLSGATSNEFGHAVFRNQHKFISENVELTDHAGTIIQTLALSDASPWDLLRTSLSDLTRSLFYQKQNYNGCHDEIRNFLFKNPAAIGMDVFAFDIQRGRDHGINPFYIYVQKCTGKMVKKFSDLKCVMSNENIKRLSEVYESVFDIDLYVGTHLEKRPNEFQFGLVGSCITNEQFYRYRHDDRFFYNNPDQCHPFTKAQRAEIRKASFSRILCDNGDINEVSENAFLAVSDENPIVSCSSVPVVDYVY